jgi:hypothetical protein
MYIISNIKTVLYSKYINIYSYKKPKNISIVNPKWIDYGVQKQPYNQNKP